MVSSGSACFHTSPHSPSLSQHGDRWCGRTRPPAICLFLPTHQPYVLLGKEHALFHANLRAGKARRQYRSAVQNARRSEVHVQNTRRDPTRESGIRISNTALCGLRCRHHVYKQKDARRKEKISKSIFSIYLSARKHKKARR